MSPSLAHSRDIRPVWAKRLNALIHEVDGQSFDGYNFCLIRQKKLSKFICPCMHRKTHSTSHWDRRRCTVRYASFRKNLSGSVLLGFGVLLVRFGDRLGHTEEHYALGWLERSFADAARE